MTFLRSLCSIFILILSISFSYSQDAQVLYSIEGSNLNYSSTEDIYGFQFNHDGCASGSAGGDAASNGFFITASSGVVMGLGLVVCIFG